MEVSHNHNAKSQLAKLLAMENITVQHKAGAKTAWFDVKNRVLTLPIWRVMSDDLYDLLVVHEVGHALDTPADGLIETINDIAKRVMGSVSNSAAAAVKGFLNVIEDARIDKRQKRRFPGSRRNYVKGYQELINSDFFGTLTKDVNSMSFIDRLNIYCKGGAMLGIKFTTEEKSLLAKVEAAETFDEVVALTEEIFRWSKQKHEDDKQEAENTRAKSGDMGDDDEEYSDEASDDNSDADDDETSSGGSFFDDDAEDEDQDEDETSDDDSETGDKSDDPIEGGSSKTLSDDTDYIPQSETDEAWQKNAETLIKNQDLEYYYAKLPKLVNYDKTVIGYKKVLADHRAEVLRFSADWIDSVRKEYQQFKSDENATVSFMVKEFEMRKSADEYSRTSISKTGVIDTNKLHSYKYNDDLFRRITTVATGKNHGFVMFVDWSGSMDSNIAKTVRQLLSLVMFCRRVQVPFEVYIFRSPTELDDDVGTRSFTLNEAEIDLSSFRARNILSSRMTTQEMNDAMFHLYVMSRGTRFNSDPMSSTPFNQTIVAASEIVNRFKAKSKVQIVNTIFLTDGESDPVGDPPKFSAIRYNSFGVRRKIMYIMEDNITKKTYNLNAGEYGYGAFYNQTITPTLLRILKDRTGCNLLGFFINSYGFEQTYRQYNSSGNAEHHSQAKKSYNDNGFFGVINAGYDEYYIINPRMFSVSNGNLTVNSDMTKRKIASEFIKFSEKKTVSRVLLSKVVKQIAA